MLAKLENTYLGILRVVILIVATIALIVAAVALIGLAPPLLRTMGVTARTPTNQPSLGKFIAEKKATAVVPAADGSTPAPVGVDAINPDIAIAARNLYDYAKDEGSPTVAVWQDLIKKQGADFVGSEANDYYTSFRHITDQLKVSKGKKLTGPQIGELFDWQKAQFQASQAELASQKVADFTKLTLMIYSAAGAFMFFILIVFTFLFVKIERSLRLVRTVREEEVHA
jgi:hypothetical protein